MRSSRTALSGVLYNLFNSALDRYLRLGIINARVFPVTKLVLYGAFSAGLNHTGSPADLKARAALIELLRLGWGHNNPGFSRTFTCRFIPKATPEHEQWFDQLQRISTSAENAARLMETDDNIDVRKMLPQIPELYRK